MIDQLFTWLAPHICEGCGAVGKPLCKRCNFNILEQKWTKCVSCLSLVPPAGFKKRGNLCSSCSRTLPYQRVFVVGERTKTLRKLVGNYKYFSRRQSAGVVAELLSNVLPPDLPDMVIVPLPTIQKHVRERGFDHMKLVARRLARLRQWPHHAGLLRRTDNTAQHSANLQQRRQQAAKAFSVKPHAPPPPRILLIDDIYTTGATVDAAARLLKKHGAQEIWLGIVARQVNK